MIYQFIGIMNKMIIYFQISVVVCHVKDLGERTHNHNSSLKLLIAGGKPTKLETYPYNVQFLNQGGMCAASILTRRHVLTAGHCFDFNKNIGDMTIVAATRYISGRTRQVHKVWDFRIHPKYNTTAVFSDDIAIIMTQEPFVFGRDVQPATLTNTTDWVKDNGTSFIATGWGQTSDGGPLSLKGLLETRLSFVPRNKCMEIYEGVKFSPDMFCLFGNGTSDTCKGDSGGGILWNKMLVGIVSHANGCVKYPGVYSSVYNYLAWIKNTTEELFQLYCRFQTFG